MKNLIHSERIEKNLAEGKSIKWWRFLARLRHMRERQAAYKEHLRARLRRKMKDGPYDMVPLTSIIPDPEKRLAAFVTYYDYARKEIDREDGITFTRLNLTLSFQAFLLAAAVFLFSSMTSLVSKSFDVAAVGQNATIQAVPIFAELLVLIVILILIAISAVGLVVCHYSYRGIKSSRDSLHWAKDMWIEFNQVNGHLYPSIVPQLTKYAMLRNRDRHKTDQGSDFALSIPKTLRFFWIFKLALWVITLVIYLVR